MSLQGLQNFTEPLSLLGFVRVKNNLNCKNIFVNGSLTGSGASGNISATNNVWTGTNDYTNTTTCSSVSVPLNNELTKKQDCDNLVLSYNPLLTNNTWNGQAVFTNTVLIPNSAISNNKLLNNAECVNFVNNFQKIPASVSNTFTGNNQFVNNIQVANIPSLLVPTLENQLASKVYVDARLEVAGKTLTYTILTPGAYSFSFINLDKIIGIDFCLFGGSLNNLTSGAFYSGKIGNANGQLSSLFLSVGIKDDQTNYTANSLTLPSNTFLKSGADFVGIAGGAYLLNGVMQGGSIYGFSDGLTPTGASFGRVNMSNVFRYSNILGTTNSTGGCILVAYYE